MAAAPSAAEILTERRRIWAKKASLRLVYGDIFARISAQMVAGPTLEVGGGSGMSRDFLGHVVTTDIVPTQWVDVAADCQALPFASAHFANLVLVDVVHHVASVPAFLYEAARVLVPGGRLIMVEPAMTAGSVRLYRAFHEEPVDMEADPFVVHDIGAQPFDANQAIPTLLLGKYRRRLEEEFAQFAVKSLRHFGLFAYPLSGGFQRWSLLPSFLTAPLLRTERHLEPLLGRVAGFRLIAVLERT